MVEPTESESLDELKRFVDAMEKIKREIFTVPDIVKNNILDISGLMIYKRRSSFPQTKKEILAL